MNRWLILRCSATRSLARAGRRDLACRPVDADALGDPGQRAVLACVVSGCFERAPSRVKHFAFVDPSGGSSDSMTLAIGSRDGDTLFLDAIREVRPPFSPEAVVAEFAITMETYGINRVQDDRYAGEWPREAFRKHGIIYEVCQQTKSDIYLNALPLLTSRRAVLLDHARLISQLCNLERRTSRVGKDTIDHAPGGHDDVCNAACGALLAAQAAAKRRVRMFFGAPFIEGCEIDPQTLRPINERRSQLVVTPMVFCALEATTRAGLPKNYGDHDDFLNTSSVKGKNTVPTHKLTDIEIAIRIVPKRLRWPESGIAWTKAHACVDALRDLIRSVDAETRTFSECPCSPSH